MNEVPVVHHDDWSVSPPGGSVKLSEEFERTLTEIPEGWILRPLFQVNPATKKRRVIAFTLVPVEVKPR